MSSRWNHGVPRDDNRLEHQDYEGGHYIHPAWPPGQQARRGARHIPPRRHDDGDEENQLSNNDAAGHDSATKRRYHNPHNNGTRGRHPRDASVPCGAASDGSGPGRRQAQRRAPSRSCRFRAEGVPLALVVLLLCTAFYTPMMVYFYCAPSFDQPLVHEEVYERCLNVCHRGTQEKLDEALGLLKAFQTQCEQPHISGACSLDEGRYALEQLQTTVTVLKKSLRVAIATTLKAGRALDHEELYREVIELIDSDEVGIVAPRLSRRSAELDAVGAESGEEGAVVDWPSPPAAKPRKCADERPECPKWAKQGQCDTSPRFMTELCRLSCKRCLSEGSGSAAREPEAQLVEEVTPRSSTETDVREAELGSLEESVGHAGALAREDESELEELQPVLQYVEGDA